MDEARTNPEASLLTNAESSLLANSESSLFRRAIYWWPYIFIAISVTGLAYIALNTPH